MKVNKGNPPAAWIEQIRARYPVEKEWDRTLTGKENRRSGPGYSPISRDDIVSDVTRFLSDKIAGSFSVTNPQWLARLIHQKCPEGLAGVA